MPTLKPGQKQVHFVLEEGSEMHQTLLEWAQNRGLTLGKASRVILADWSDALNGRLNPFAAAIAAATGQSIQPSPASPAQAQELNAEERARQAALLQAAEQFL